MNAVRESRAVFRRAFVDSLPVLMGYVTMGFVAGALLCMCLLGGGCSTHRALELDAENPSVRISNSGVLFADRCVRPQDVPGCLEDYDVPHDRVIHILLDPDVKDLRPARFLMACLSKGGYTRPVLVTKRHAEAVNVGKPKRKTARSATTTSSGRSRTIRYKRAAE